MKDRRLAYLLSQYPTANHTYLLREVRGLRALGWEVRVLSVRPSDRPVALLDPIEREEQELTTYILQGSALRAAARAFAAGIRRPIATARALRSATRYACSMRDLLRFVAYTGEAAIVAGLLSEDDAHVHGHFCSQLLLMLDAFIPGRWSTTLHGPEEFDGERATLLPFTVRHAAFTRVISTFGRAIVLHRGALPPERVFINRLGVPSAWLAQVTHAPRVRGSGKIVLSVGRLSAEKGQRFLLEAFARLTEEDYTLQLRLVGDGPIRQELESFALKRGIASNVSFLGWQSAEMVRTEMSAADLFVSSSFAEGVPLVLMEAMAVGLPVVATSVGGVADLVRDGSTGLIVPPADINALATAIRHLITNQDLPARCVAAGREMVQEHFCLETNVQQLSEQFAARTRPADPLAT